MRFGTALKAARAGFHVRRTCWGDAPESMHESGIGPGLVWNDGGFVLEWADIGFDCDRVSYTDLDADDWELTERVDFGGALHLMHLGFYVRRQHWTGYACLGIETNDGVVEFHHESSSGDSHGFHSVEDSFWVLEDGTDTDFPGLTREDRFAKDWVITSGEYIPTPPPAVMVRLDEAPPATKELHTLVMAHVNAIPRRLSVADAKQVLVHFKVARFANLTHEQAVEGKAMVEKMVEAGPKFVSTVREAVMRLDPEVAGHWVMTGAHKGKPKLQVVEDAYGRGGITRQHVEAAMPGYNRAKATEAALAP